MLFSFPIDCWLFHVKPCCAVTQAFLPHVDESEVLTPADPENHINKTKFGVPFVCGAKSLGEALRRIAEGASMIRMKGKAGTGNLIEAVRHTRDIFKEIRRLKSMDEDEVCTFAKRKTYDIFGSAVSRLRGNV